MKLNEENDKGRKAEEESKRNGSTGKQEKIDNTPPKSLNDIDSVRNDVIQTDVNPASKKRTQKNRQKDGNDDPNAPINPPAL